MEQRPLLEDSLNYITNPCGSCVAKAFKDRDSQLCTASFDMDKRRKRSLGAQERIGGSKCQCEAVQPFILQKSGGAEPFAGGFLELHQKALVTLCWQPTPHHSVNTKNGG